MSKQPSVAKRGSLLSLLFTFAVDNLGATIVFPIFAPLFLDPSQGLLSSSLSEGARGTLLGLFLAAFPLSQFFFSPLLGDYSDHRGRKPALLITTSFTFFGYILSAYSIHAHALIPLFIARLIMGVGAGNLSICMSSMADLSTSSRKKKHYFSLGSAIAGVTFVLGPLLGGKLSDPSLSTFFHPAFPMWIGAMLAGINLLFLLFAFEESLEKQSEADFDFLKGVHNILMVVRKRNIRNLFLVYLLYLLAWNTFFQFIPAYLVENFSFTNSNIGDVCALMGVFWIVGTGVLYKLLHNHIKDHPFLVGTLLLFGLGTFFLPFFTTVSWFILLVGGCTMISGIIWPLCTTTISDAADARMQGKVLGVSQSVLSLSLVISALIGGGFLNISVKVPFFAGACFLLIAALFTFACKFPDESPKHQ